MISPIRYRLELKRVIAAPIRIPTPVATGLVESLGDLLTWRWPSGVQFFAP